MNKTQGPHHIFNHYAAVILHYGHDQRGFSEHKPAMIEVRSDAEWKNKDLAKSKAGLEATVEGARRKHRPACLPVAPAGTPRPAG